MEKQLSFVKKIIIFVAAVMICGKAFAQTPSVVQNIRFPLWAELDAYPGTEFAAEDIIAEEYAYPLRRIKDVAPFLMDGMVYGWKFSYTPSDKTRGVEEYFSVEPIQLVESTKKNIRYSSVWIEDNKFNCWVDYTRSTYQVDDYNHWASIQNPAIQGTGYGDLSKGFDGIKDAAKDALKDAVRSYYQEVLKNKPKEITGSVLIRKTPTMGVKNGQYVINLDFFLECGRIKEYTQF